MRQTVLLILVLMLTPILHADVIIFDFDGVLATPNRMAIIRAVKMHNFIGWYNPFNAKKILFDFLETLEPHRPTTPRVMRGKSVIPQIVCDWIAGIISGKQILKKVDEHIPHIPKKYHAMIRAVTHFMFTPEVYASTCKPLKKGVRLFKKCRNASDAQGKRRHRIYILSNLDRPSFEALSLNPIFKAIFDQCDGILISGDINMMKPDPQIYDYFFKKFDINPEVERCIYIDDELSNIRSAHGLGKKHLICLQCKKGKLKPIKKRLQSLQAI